MSYKKFYSAFLLATGVVADLLKAMAGELPPGVPRWVDPDGKNVYLKSSFTSKAYHDEALRLVILEANEVAKELGLAEKLPIAKSDLKGAFISPFGYAYRKKKIGNITTSNYFYGVEQGNKFSNLAITDLDGHCFDYRKRYQLPIDEIDTNKAVSLATDYLAALRVDVQMLGRECNIVSEISSFWNGVQRGEKPSLTTFVPIYDVFWLPKAHTNAFGDVAMVELFLPGKSVLQLTVYDEKYILRKPMIFTNLAILFPGNAAIITNVPVKPTIGPALRD